MGEWVGGWGVLLGGGEEGGARARRCAVAVALRSLPRSPPSQVKYILGLKIPRSDKLTESLKLIFTNLNQFK